MPWFDVEVHKEQHYFTIEADTEEQAEAQARAMAYEDIYEMETWTYVEEVSIAEMMARKEPEFLDAGRKAGVI